MEWVLTTYATKRLGLAASLVVANLMILPFAVRSIDRWIDPYSHLGVFGDGSYTGPPDS